MTTTTTTTTLTRPRPETRAQFTARMLALGVPEGGPALEALLQETGAVRHAARREYVVRVALDAAEGLKPTPRLSDGRSVAFLLLLLDTLGVGGTGGVTGAASARVPALAGQVARKQQSAGRAWTAAVQGALGALGPLGVRVEAREDGLRLTPQGQGEMAEEEPGGLLLGAEALRGPTWAPYGPWMRTLAREGLRRAVGLPPWFPEVGFPVEWGGTPAGWAALVELVSRESPPDAEVPCDDGVEVPS
jgi:hypothetical protein